MWHGTNCYDRGSYEQSSESAAPKILTRLIKHFNLILEPISMMASDEKSDKVPSALYFDGEDETKWEAWSFKMLAYAQEKGHKEAFTLKFTFGANLDECDKKAKKFEWRLHGRTSL